MMNSDTPLDCAVFELSPRRSRCELFVSGGGRTEKLASGLLKPFITHLKVVEEQEQTALPGKSIKLVVERSSNGNPWFNKGTLERFVRFVSTPEVLESANTYDAEMSQLEGARKIYSQGAGNMVSGSVGENDATSVEVADITKKELLRAIDVRLATLKQDLSTACSRAFSAGFSVDSVSELLLFAEYFGANRLIEACNKFILLCQRLPELTSQLKQSHSLTLHLKSFSKGSIRSSTNSDMSIDEPELELGAGKPPNGDIQVQNSQISQSSQPNVTVLPSASHLDKPMLRQRAVSEEPISSASSANVPAQLDRGNSRRLSVQDRINLFESKQKEQTVNSGNINSTAVNRVVAGKGHRRLSSDVSEKSVLRRWSGASDMSIDITSCNSNSYNDPKESGSVIGTPTSTTLQVPSRSKTEETDVSKDTATSQCQLDLKEIKKCASSFLEPQSKGFSSDKECTDDETVKSSTKVVPSLEKGKLYISASMKRVEHCGLDDPDTSRIYQKGFQEASNNAKHREPEASNIQSKGEVQFQMEDKAVLPEISQDVPVAAERVGWRDQELLLSQTKEIPARADDARAKDQTKLVNQFRVERRTDAKVKEVKAKVPSNSQVQSKVLSGLSTESDVLKTSRSQGKSFPVKEEEALAGHDTSSHEPSEASLVKIKEVADNQGRNVQQQLSDRGASVVNIPNSETGRVPAFHSRKAKETQKVIEPPAFRTEQVQVTKPSKGTQELNDELRMKADELEKLFAAHKLRTLGEQTTSSRRSKPVAAQEVHVPIATDKRHEVKRHEVIPPDDFHEKRSASETFENEEFDAKFRKKKVDNDQSDSSVNEKLDTPSLSDDSRGKLYYKYMKKRNAKLLEEEETKRAQKDAKMKEMQDSLEYSQAEMNSRYSGFGDRRGSSVDRRHAAKLRLLGKRKNQAVGSVLEEEKDLEELYAQGGHDQAGSYNDPLGDDSSKSINFIKFLSTKTMSSSTPRIPAASHPKSCVKSTKSVSTKHRPRTENPFAESLPNYSDLRKENAKPSATINRVNTRERSKILSRSKSIIEETNVVKEDNPCRSQSMRRSTAVPGELKDLSLHTSDSPDFATLEFDKALTGLTCSNKVNKSGALKSFARKGKGPGPGLAANISKSKAFTVSGIDKNVEYYESMVQSGNLPELYNDETKRSFAERDAEPTDYPVDSDSEKPRHSHEYENSDDFGSEDGDFQRSLCQADYDTAPISPKFNIPAGNVPSPAEIPPSWSSHLHHSFPFAHEASDIDASVDSPIGSPASWSLHPMNQMDADAARMRKKWGSAQMPMIVANASQQSRKDVTKGFKRLLKFRRKSRGVESLVTDWVSASTASEGDDDIEDGRDLSMRMTEDLRKTRMGYTLPRAGFSEEDIFSEQVETLRSSIPHPPANFKLSEDHLTGSSLKAPRSFFSLSSFRSKESKPR